MDYTEDQLKTAARKAMQDGNVAAARKLIARAKAAGRPKADTSFMGRVKDNVIGVDDGIQSRGEKLAALLNKAGESLTLGVGGDEFNAAIDSAVGRRSYGEGLQFYRDQQEQIETSNPKTSLAADILPALLSPVGPIAAAKTAATVGGRALRAGGSAAAGGGLFGFMEGEGGATERAKNAGITAGLSAPLGAAGPALGGKVAKAVNKRRMGKAVKEAAALAPQGDDLAAQAGALFEKARGATMPREAFSDRLPQITASARAAGLRPTSAGAKLAPNSSAVMSEIGDVAGNASPSIGFDEIHDLRKLTAAATGNFNNPFDQRIGASIRDGIDAVVEGMDENVSAQVKEANRMWKILRKSEMLDEIFDRASRQASGFENGLRIQFRQILNNPKKRAQFTKAELQAMEEIPKGTFFGNIMKKIGKLGFGRGQQSNVLSGTAGMAVFGPAAGVAGQGAMAISEGLTARRAQALQDLVRTGGAPDVKLLPNGIGAFDALSQGIAPRLVEGIR